MPTTVIPSLNHGTEFLLSGDDAVAELIAARDCNNLYRASRFFRDPERYRAFCAQYAVMRVIDDRIDALPHRRLSAAALAEEERVLGAWEEVLARIYERGPEPEGALLAALDHQNAAPLVRALGRSLERFPVPRLLWTDFLAAMRSDLRRSRFPTFAEFLQYAEGATVAPTTIYLYLLGALPDADGSYHLPLGFRLHEAGRALGLFAYLAHVVRDLPEDLATGEEGLLYLAAGDMAAHGVTESALRQALRMGRASEAVRSLTATLIRRARGFLEEGRSFLEPLRRQIPADCAFILELTIALYVETLNKLETCGGDPFGGGHRLGDWEKCRIVFSTARTVGFDAGLFPQPG